MGLVNPQEKKLWIKWSLNAKKICEKRDANGFLIICSLLTCNPDYLQLKPLKCYDKNSLKCRKLYANYCTVMSKLSVYFHYKLNK